MTRLSNFLICCILVTACTKPETPSAEKSYKSYDELVTLFKEWREFQKPSMNEGVPDYTESAMQRQHDELASWQQRLNAFDTVGWSIKHQVDWYLVWAEMNGLDFDHRVIRPWVRDPSFYVWFYPDPSDVPEREGPNIFGAVELPAYNQPLSEADASEIASRLRLAPKVFQQARNNLTGNAKDLWITGIRPVRTQSDDLSRFAESVKGRYPDLAMAAGEARAASDEFVAWLEEQAPGKDGPSGIGKEDYDWYVHNVHLTPYSWHDEKILLERELARAHTSLRFAEHRNRNLPTLEKASTAESYNKMLTEGVNEFLDFMETDSFMTVKPYMKPAMMAQIHDFVENNGIRGFFDEVDYRDPMPMRAHHFHWIDKDREKLEPVESPIRRVPLLYNIFDSRAEGVATAMEEIILHAGMLEDRPRAKELVYIMLIQRAARGLAGLYQHGGEMTFDEATQYASRWVPRGLLPADGGTIQGEEQFYLQQPGYGSSYVVGKLELDRLIAEYTRQRKDNFSPREFMDEFVSKGIIPMSLIYWEMTGSKELLSMGQ